MDGILTKRKKHRQYLAAQSDVFYEDYRTYRNKLNSFIRYAERKYSSDKF